MARTRPHASVFAVEPDALQVTWRDMPPGPVTISTHGARQHVETEGGPGAARLTGLTPATDVVVELSEPDGTAISMQARTLDPPRGEELSRFSTLSDMHLGETSFGIMGTMRERRRTGPAHPERCTEAALDEALAWGASRVVVKGDITSRGKPGEYRTLRALATASGLPYDAVPGNHEVKSYREVDPSHGFDAMGSALADPVHVIDIPGLRMLLIDTTVLGSHRGQLDPAIEPVCDLSHGHPTLLVMHHFPQRHRVPHFWPPGIPPAEAERFFTAVRAANPNVMAIAGHTHRHRRYVRHGVTVAETGSPKDYPGTWTGYVVHEGGIRQVVQRVARPDCIRWNDYTRRAAGGVWGHWSPGRRRDRCFTVGWV